MKTIVTYLCVCFVFIGTMSAAFAHCGGCGTGDTHSHTKEVSEKLCSKCGEIKGTPKCSKPAKKCTTCGLHKGSPGCRKAEKAEVVEEEFVGGCGVPMCFKCGHEMFTEECDEECQKIDKEKAAKKCATKKCASKKDCSAKACKTKKK